MAADTVAIAAGSVVAPAAHVSLGAIHKNPETPGIRADFQAIMRIVRERFGERSGDARERGGPANLCGFAFQVQPILVLHQAAKNRYLEPSIEGFHISGAQRGAGGSFLDEVAEEFAELAKRGDLGRAGGRDAEAPEFEEIGDPLGVVEKIGEAAVAVPHFAIGEVHPGRGGAEVMHVKGVRSGDHGNEIKAIDTLQTGLYRVK